MLKQKCESFMLNKYISQITFSTSYSYSRILPVVLLALMISACSVNPESAPQATKQLSPETKKLYAEAIKKMKSGNTKKAQLLLSKVIRQQPGFSNAYVNMGILYIKMNMNKKAELSFQQALKIEPGNKYALNQQAFIYRVNGDFAKAKENYEKAINIDSDYANAHLNLGILYDLYLYDLESALQQYKKYNELSKGKNKQVSKWIFELERRYKKSLSQK